MATLSAGFGGHVNAAPADHRLGDLGQPAMIPLFATSLTWLRAFSGPCAVLAAVALVTGGTLGSCVTKRLTDRRALVAERALSDVRAEIATQAAATEERAAQLRENALYAIRERDREITSAVDGIPAAVARLVAPQFAKLRESVNDTRFDCLRQPLPDDFLRELRRPGGSAAAEDHPDPDTR